MRPRPARYVFDRFELRPSERALLAGGVAQSLTPRAFDLLVALVERGGELVSKDELFDRVWPGVVVEENNLQVQVSALRKVLGPGAIETVAGYGYRFKPAVTVDAALPAASRRDNLPHALTRFIGRAREVDECAGLLKATRLLKLTGVGGMGKTRLALRVADTLVAEYPDGVWLMELAAFSDPRLVVQEIARVLGVSEQAKRSLLESIAIFLRNRRLLLVLDNCEHLLRECAAVARRLLEAAADVVVLATSREPLRVAGETTYPLPSLSMPADTPGPTLDAAARSDAVRLFVERARAVQRDFELTPANARAVSEICTRLDGIPLAIELAAARVRVLSAEGVAQRLDQRFRLLKVADPTTPARQQTLEAAIDWSYDLLTPQEKALFARLAVFAVSWTLDAAEDVGAAADIERWEILDVQGNLVERSLVVAGPDNRYRFLESIRLYAQRRLHESGEEAAMRTRHLGCFVAFANGGPETAGPRDEAWLARLDAERENLRAACEWATGDGADPASALRLVSPIGFWLCRNNFDLGTPILGEVLAQPEVARRDELRFHGVATAGFLSYHRGSYADAKRYAEEALALARQAGDPLMLWVATNVLAEVLSLAGETKAATPLYEEALALGRGMGSRNLTMVGLLNLARVSLTTGAAVRARELMRESLPIFDEMGGDRNLHCLLFFCAGLAAQQEEWERAARFLGASERDLERMDMRREPPDDVALAPLLAAARTTLGEDAFAAAEAAGRALERAEAARELRAWLAATA